jgi:CHAT domain-containing protein
VHDVAVLASEYDESTDLTSLTAALAEAKYMVDAYGAITVEATEDAVRLLLDAKITRNDGSPAEINIVHLACHADSDPTRPGDAGFYLASGRRITPRVFGASKLGSRFGPLLFINACEAGVAQRLLAQTAGFAGVSLRGGFRGFIAPLWSVGDEAASQVAHQFYAAVFGGEIPSVGSVLRDIRRSAMPIHQATPFSYIYYGHPHLRLGAKDDRRIAVQDNA